MQRREFRLHESAVISVTPARAQSIGFQARSELVWQLQSPFFLAEHDRQTRELRAALVCIGCHLLMCCITMVTFELIVVCVATVGRIVGPNRPMARPR